MRFWVSPAPIKHQIPGAAVLGQQFLRVFCFLQGTIVVVRIHHLNKRTQRGSLQGDLQGAASSRFFARETVLINLQRAPVNTALTKSLSKRQIQPGNQQFGLGWNPFPSIYPSQSQGLSNRPPECMLAGGSRSPERWIRRRTATVSHASRKRPCCWNQRDVLQKVICFSCGSHLASRNSRNSG